MKSKSISPPEHRLLLICRHAKSSWQDPTLADFDRPLNRRGERDAPKMGQRLAKRQINPDLIMTSPAVRALRTALHYADQLRYPEERLRLNRDQYLATVPTLIELLRQTDDQARVVLIVGHNPESTELANALGSLAIENIPTGGIVALKLDLSTWRELAPGIATLLFFDYPKNEG